MMKAGVQSAVLSVSTAVVLMYALASTGCSAHKSNGPMLHVDQAFNGREVVVTKPDTFELSLAENPTTGYRWEFKSSGAPVCRLVSTEFDASSGGVGSGGTRRWRFQVTGTGVATIELAYRRVFEADKPPARTFELTLRSKE
jgi:inhibitor of cysteine peptidase